MKNEIDSKTLLWVYEHIQKHGEQTDEGKFYEGLTAFSDVDGYCRYLLLLLLAIAFCLDNHRKTG